MNISADQSNHQSNHQSIHQSIHQSNHQSIHQSETQDGEQGRQGDPSSTARLGKQQKKKILREKRIFKKNIQRKEKKKLNASEYRKQLMEMGSDEAIAE